MIHDLDSTLKELLTQELPPALTAQVAISFDTPDNQFPPTGVTLPAINLFLYDIRENRELRSNEWRVEAQGNSALVRKRAPVRVDCSYLITAWASASAPNPAQDEHRILGEVMKALLRQTTIPVALVQGELATQDLPLPTTVLQPGNLQSLGEFWQALGGKPRAVLNFTVTISVDPFAAEEVPIVLERIFRPPSTG